MVGVSLGRLRGGGSGAQAKWGTRVDAGTGGYADSRPPWDPALPRAGCPSPASPCFATWCLSLSPSCLTVLRDYPASGRCELLLWLLRNSLPLLLCPTHLPTEGVSGASFWRAGGVARGLVLDNDAAQYLTPLGKALPAPKPLQPARDPVFVSMRR